MNYPPTMLAASNTFTISQISDLHLEGQLGSAPSYQKFLQVLALAQNEHPDLLLLTGDLVNDGNKQVYDWLFKTLENTQIAFACIAGNHDVTLEHGKGLSFEARSFEPIEADTRLLNQHKLTINLTQGAWQLLLLNSAVNGKIHGQLSTESLIWLKNQLDNQTPTVIAMHHHPIDVGSAWIDAHRLQNHAEFWQIINQHPNVKAILCGHVHQAHTLTAPTKHPCTIYTCPSTDRQFMPYQDDFTLDKQQGGLRILQLDHHAIIATNTKRYDVCPK